jgi:ABC-type transport system substrate-binding protein
MHGYNNPEVDRLLEATQSTGDMEERAALFQEMQAFLQADVPNTFLHYTIDFTGSCNDVKNYVPVPEMCYMETMWLDR